MLITISTAQLFIHLLHARSSASFMLGLGLGATQAWVFEKSNRNFTFPIGSMELLNIYLPLVVFLWYMEANIPYMDHIWDTLFQSFDECMPPTTTTTTTTTKKTKILKDRVLSNFRLLEDGIFTRPKIRSKLQNQESPIKTF